jgi:hypothetical protein
MEDHKSSYEKINYSLRPGKAIERKMLCEALKYLSFIQKLNKYKYIGFGSTHFVDFSLFHRMLGLTNLLSIEKDARNEMRFRFNKPFSRIDLKFGDSNEILPKLNWDKLSIVWLDYDSKLRKNINDPMLHSNMFADIESFFFKAKPGSVFLVTIDVKPDHPKEIVGKEEMKIPAFEEDIAKFRMNQLIERIGLDKIPVKYRDLNLNIENNPKVIYHIVSNEIFEIIKRRNYGNSKENIHYQQLFNFIYNDGTLMLTIGGLIYNDRQLEAVEKVFTHLDDLEFIKKDEELFEIIVPQLTFKEIQLLDSFLPDRIDKETGRMVQDKKFPRNIPTLPDYDKINYSKIYKYFPTFAETVV